MKFKLFLILAFCMSALFSPVVFGAELGGAVIMPEYNKSLPAIQLVGDRIISDHAGVNANILFTLQNSSFSPSQLANSDMNDPWMKAGNPKFVNHKGAAVLTSKAELAGASLSMESTNNKPQPGVFI